MVVTRRLTGRRNSLANPFNKRILVLEVENIAIGDTGQQLQSSVYIRTCKAYLCPTWPSMFGPSRQPTSAARTENRIC